MRIMPYKAYHTFSSMFLPLFQRAVDDKGYTVIVAKEAAEAYSLRGLCSDLWCLPVVAAT